MVNNIYQWLTISMVNNIYQWLTIFING